MRLVRRLSDPRVRAHNGDDKTIAAMRWSRWCGAGHPEYLQHNESFVPLSSKLFPLDRISNLHDTAASI